MQGTGLIKVTKRATASVEAQRLPSVTDDQCDFRFDLFFSFSFVLVFIIFRFSFSFSFPVIS